MPPRARHPPPAARQPDRASCPDGTPAGVPGISSCRSGMPDRAASLTGAGPPPSASGSDPTPTTMDTTSEATPPGVPSDQHSVPGWARELPPSARQPRLPSQSARRRANEGSGDRERGDRWDADSCVRPERSSSRRCGQLCLCFADKTRRIHRTKEIECRLELVIGLGPPPGPAELLGGAEPREGGRPGSAHRVQQLGRRHEFPVSQRAGGNEPGRIAPGSEPLPRFGGAAQHLSGKHTVRRRLANTAQIGGPGVE